MTAYKNWQIKQDQEKIIWLALDCEKGNTNVLSATVLAELQQILSEINKQTARGLVIYSAKKNGFLAGADVTEFSALKTTAAAFEKLRDGQIVFDQIESLPFPTVAMIHGFCLGGGLELALACTYRVAESADDCKLGLPEVRLGIHPGYGGSVRLPEVTGDLQALQIMLAGRVIRARQALRIGLLDMAVPKRQLHVSAQQILIHGKKKKPLSVIKSWPSLPVARQLTAKFMRMQLKKKINAEHYPAPYALLSTWENFSSRREQRFFEEANSVTDLFANSSTTQQLVRVFGLQERMKSLAKNSDFKPKHVHVVGAGVMGGDIATWCAMQGFHVTLQDREAKYIAPAIKRAHALYDKKLPVAHINTAAKDRLIPDVSGAGARNADVIIEAIYENLEAKQALYASLEPYLSENTILATNTSSIPLEDLAAKLKDPTRLLGLHFFNPVAKMQLVEIIFAQNTNQKMLDNAASFVKDIKRLPLPVKSSFGFLVNRILMPYLMEAVTMVGEGLAPEEIDHAAVSFGMPMGPIELADVVGLDICNHVGQVLADAFNLPTASILQRKIDRGDLGKKSGYGFYAWQKGRPVKQKQKNQSVNVDVQDRLILSLVNEAMKCHQEQLVTDDDLLDAGIIFGTGFAPFRGGPMQYIRTTGASVLHGRLVELVQLYGDRFAPSDGWKNFE